LEVPDRRSFAVKNPPNKLSEFERVLVLKHANSPEFCDLPPKKIVPMLADKGIYIASESSFYRILKAENQLKHRSKSRPPRNVPKPAELTANAPNQVYSWDITYLPTDITGVFFYLYLVLDIYSRKIVGWQVYERESADFAADLITDICANNKIIKGQITLHSDNGSPMKGASMLATMQKLGVISSYSRPATSNDNPFSESVFKTLKYNKLFPEKPFQNLLQARNWVNQFVNWYNFEHLHSSISFVTPHQRHSGQDVNILKNRQKVYQTAKNKTPNRWAKNIRKWQPNSEVYLNKSNTKKNKNAQN
jgi:transposase InsO family protein